MLHSLKKSLIHVPFFLSISAMLFWGASCHTQSSKKKDDSAREARQRVEPPPFNADSAYRYIQKQVDFGPRVPNTPEHEACARWLESSMRQFADSVIVQEGEVTAFDGTKLQIKNIISQFQPEKNNRILLFAHWDTRPFADYDPDPEKRNQPIDGANDGGSGVGVLMEIARHLQEKPTDTGIDIIFFDAEDYGTPHHMDVPYQADTWCLGSQYWGRNPHEKGYYARYGILLDMVGAQNALFYQERASLDMAPELVDYIWETAEDLGHGNYFVFRKGSHITDDHIYVNRHTGIPAANIIEYDPTSNTSFGKYWHTHDDNMEIIDRKTLNAVGETVMEVIYNPL